MRRTDPVGVLKGRLAAMPQRLRLQANAALVQAGTALIAAARRRLEQGSGPTPSAPGGPPRDASGRIAASLGATLEAEAARVVVAATIPHAAFLEYGTRTMAARPFLRPAVEETREDAREACRQALARATRDERGSP